MQNELPEWAMEAGRKISGIWFAPFHHDHELLAQDIARALVAAEHRGLDRSAKFVVEFARAGARDRAEMHDKRMVNLFAQMEAVLPAAIRKLGENHDRQHHSRPSSPR